MSPATETTLAPQCIRFRPEDLALIKKAAKKADERVSPWVRRAVSDHTEKFLDGASISGIARVSPGSEVRCVRFRPLAMSRLEKVAKLQSITVAMWIRSAAVHAASLALGRT